MIMNIRRFWIGGGGGPAGSGRLTAQGKLNVVASTEDLASIASRVGGDKVSVTGLAKAIRIRISWSRSQASSWR
jgi:ABC-type Zn uptake system ZnuABC Zn-binding protein ZnuA